MIISVRSISYDELKRNLTYDDKIVVWSCDTCIKYCGLGGMEKIRVLEDMLKEDGYNVIKTELISESCLINLVRKHRTNGRESFREATAIVALTCEVGYTCVREIFGDKKVIKTVKTFGAGNFSIRKGPILTSPLPEANLEFSVQGYTLNDLAEKFNLYPNFFDSDKKPQPKMVDIRVNGELFKAKEGANLLDALLSLGFRIPHLCYEPSLGNIGVCLLCLVKIKNRRGLVPSCCTVIEEGIDVTTEDEEINKLRKTILEMILAERGTVLLDKSREIRQWARKYGIGEPRFQLPIEPKPMDDSSEVFKRDPNSCILCGRCVVACREVSGQRVLDFAHRGSKMTVVAGLSEPIGQTDCAHCMACANYCPTNAITPKIIVKSFKG